MIPESDTNPTEATCPRCEERLICGARSGDATCWCFDLGSVGASALAEYPPDRCLCRACLTEISLRKASAEHL